MKTWLELYNPIVKPEPSSALTSEQGQNTTWTASSIDRIMVEGLSFSSFLDTLMYWEDE